MEFAVNKKRLVLSVAPIARFFRWWRRWRLKQQDPARLLHVFGKNYPDAMFMQIGSNDGVKMDPLRPEILRTRWKGILVEPLPHIFDRLVENYDKYSDRLQFKNVAIASERGVKPFYYLRKVEDAERKSVPAWYELLGSFNKDILLSHEAAIPNVSQLIESTQVRCMTFNSLCEEADINHLDLLHIDAEGYDYEILKTIDFNRYRPRVLIYEHLHLADTDKHNCDAYLRELGYDFYKTGMDTWCLYQEGLKKQDIKIRRVWKSLLQAQKFLR